MDSSLQVVQTGPMEWRIRLNDCGGFSAELYDTEDCARVAAEHQASQIEFQQGQKVHVWVGAPLAIPPALCLFYGGQLFMDDLGRLLLEEV